MEMSFYETYPLIMKDNDRSFGIVELQNDNTLNVEREPFMKKEEKEIIKARLKAKNQIIQEISLSADFGGYSMTIEAESIIVLQRNEAEKLVLIDVKNNAKKQWYIEQRTCSAYIA